MVATFGMATGGGGTIMRKNWLEKKKAET